MHLVKHEQAEADTHMYVPQSTLAQIVLLCVCLTVRLLSLVPWYLVTFLGSLTLFNKVGTLFVVPGHAAEAAETAVDAVCNIDFLVLTVPCRTPVIPA